MGLLETDWKAEYEGHTIEVARNELTRGFEARIDGLRVGGKLVTLVGLGTAEGTFELGGRQVPVKVELKMFSHCNVWIDGKPVEMTRVK
jgi:hypothetical protein